MKSESSEALVLVGDHHDVACAGLKYIASVVEPGIEIVEAAGFDGVLELLDELPAIRLCLLDNHLPGMNGFEGISCLCSRRPDVLVAMMSDSKSALEAKEAFDEGAVGYLPKTMRAEAMVGAIRLMLGGEQFIPAGLLSEPGQIDAGAPKLTPRERSVLAGLVQGLSNKLIAQELGIREVTVGVHATRLYRKLGVRTRTQAVLQAHAVR